jgi:hypothetical protein
VVLTPAFITQPSSAGQLVQRVNLNARRGRWREATADAALALKSQPGDHYRYHTLAALMAMTGDRSGYEDVCQKLVTKFPSPSNPFIAERVAQDCLLLPNSGVDLKLIDNLADAAVRLGNADPSLPYFQVCKAMSDYRLGRFSEAVDWAEKAVQSTRAEPEAKAKAFSVLAMANWQVGNKNAARAALVQGDSLAPVFFHEPDDSDLGESWVAWLIARISLDEAAKIIQTDSTIDTSNQQ